MVSTRSNTRRLTAAHAVALALGLVLAFAGFAPALAADTAPLEQRISPEIRARLFPTADRFGPVEGTPPSIAAYKSAAPVAARAAMAGGDQFQRGEDELLGFMFSTLDAVPTPGFSGIPFDAIGGVDVNGRMTGGWTIYQMDPHLRDDNGAAGAQDTEGRMGYLQKLLMAQSGLPTLGPIQGPDPDIVSGATVSARLVRTALYDAARMVLRDRGLGKEITEPTLDIESYRPLSLAELVGDGLVVERKITNADLDRLLAEAGLAGATPEVAPRGKPEDVYADLAVALVSPAEIGRNMLSAGPYDEVLTRDVPGHYTILAASGGRYDVLGDAGKRGATVPFDRIAIEQDGRPIAISPETYQRAVPTTNRYGLFSFSFAGLFPATAADGFDPMAPFRVNFLIHATKADGSPATLTVPVDYVVPDTLILRPPPPPVPVWVEAWQDARTDVIVLLSALLVLTLILAFQQRLTRYRRIYRPLRNLFLVFTLVWLGWMVGGQLSIIHIVNYLKAPFEGFGVGFYLAEPIIVVVAIYAAVALVLLGRGVFCGWLCPFGALQELLAQVARLLRLPQWNPSDAVQKRLWMVKYVAAAVVIGLAFVAPDAGSVAAEVEPFKQMITSPFQRSWPFIVYGLALLAVGLFTERAFCRFLCPLGGTLAVLDRLHVLDLLRRRPECGNPCQLCSHSCPVKAIEPSGRIKMAECFQCLDCQVEYHDDHRCPPLVKGRKQAARAAGGKVIIRPVPAIARVAEGPAE